MSNLDFLSNINGLMSEYYQLWQKLDNRVDGERFRSTSLADLADQIAARLEEEADHYRSQATRWRDGN
ncbi:hypothetical protein DL990_30445 [Amycolatopsis sp. WAC 01416]|uniref:hypothetical protein n=1 Tax=Amycolatopsis sp. WAC 01416 TaxID=2203196 RepID=UPI000F78CCE9|nr:hypothetical protein [Amycolatopsis sp. WAC 01416]RSN27497.1 hypothetical protein DL990_30445 [Amycolatopsis sp. WAC 01416]